MTIIKTTYAAAEPLGPQYQFGNLNSVGDLISGFIEPMFAAAAIVVVVLLVLSAVKFITSGGDKESIAGARKTITYAIIGFILLIVLFLVLQYLPSLFGLNDLKIIN